MHYFVKCKKLNSPRKYREVGCKNVIMEKCFKQQHFISNAKAQISKKKIKCVDQKEIGGRGVKPLPAHYNFCSQNATISRIYAPKVNESVFNQKVIQQ